MGGLKYTALLSMISRYCFYCRHFHLKCSIMHIGMVLVTVAIQCDGDRIRHVPACTVSRYTMLGHSMSTTEKGKLINPFG